LAHIVLCLFTMIKVLKSNSSTLYKISESLPTMFPEFPALKFSELSLLISLQEKVTPNGWPFCYHDPYKFHILKCLLSWRHLYQSPKFDFGHCHFEIVLGSQKCFLWRYLFQLKIVRKSRNQQLTWHSLRGQQNVFFPSNHSLLYLPFCHFRGLELIWLEETWLKSSHKLE